MAFVRKTVDNVGKQFFETLQAEWDPVDSKSLVMAAFDVVYIDGDKVSFTTSPEVTNKTKAVFLTNVKEDPTNKLTATRVKPEDLHTFFGDTKPLLCAHGWGGRPDQWINICDGEQKTTFSEISDNKYTLVPVLWPAAIRPQCLKWNLIENTPAELSGYNNSREAASKAGQAAARLLADVSDKQFDFLCVSMGNWFLKELAKEAVANGVMEVFNEIYMSAADVDSNIFTSDIGGNIVKLLKKEGDGKIYVFVNKEDIALKTSTIGLNARFPLHRLGLGLKHENISKKYRDKVQVVDVNTYLSEDKDDRDQQDHGYMFKKSVVKFYNTKECTLMIL